MSGSRARTTITRPRPASRRSAGRCARRSRAKATRGGAEHQGRAVTLAIVDLGCGNVGSVDLRFERLGAETKITDDLARIAAAERVVLPGVGAAGHAMERIDALGLRDTLQRRDRPMLGICLGMQLLFERSEEDDTDCLGLVAGPGAAARCRRPAGRCRTWAGAGSTIRDDIAGLNSGDYVYFAHSLRLRRRPAQRRHRRLWPAVHRRGAAGATARGAVPPGAQQRSRRTLPGGLPRHDRSIPPST